MRGRAPRRHGVRRRSRGRPVDRAGQAGRLLHGHQRRGRHRRHDPDEAGASARPSSESAAASSASTRSSSSGCPTGSWSTASTCDARSPPSVRRHRPEIVITGNFRDTWGGREPQPGRPHRRRQGRARRRARRRQPLGLRRAGRPAASSRGAASARCGRSARPSPATRSTPPTPSTRASRRWRRTRPTSTGSAGSTSTPASSSRAWPAAPGSGSASVRRAVRGVPDGLGRLTRAQRGSRWKHAELVPLRIREHGEPLVAGLADVGAPGTEAESAGSTSCSTSSSCGRRSTCKRSLSRLASETRLQPDRRHVSYCVRGREELGRAVVTGLDRQPERLDQNRAWTSGSCTSRV